jgi:hypothetical protein
MFVYLGGSPTKGVVASHHLIVNPAEHLGTGRVVTTLTAKDDDGKVVGKTFHVHFVNGRADADPDALGRYMIEYGLALAAPWTPPANAPIAADDPGGRWREGRV